MALALVLSAMLVRGPAPAAPPASPVERRVVAMGTSFDVLVRVADRSRGLAAIESAIEEVGRLEERLSTWRGDGPLWRLNRAAPGETDSARHGDLRARLRGLSLGRKDGAGLRCRPFSRSCAPGICAAKGESPHRKRSPRRSARREDPLPARPRPQDDRAARRPGRHRRGRLGQGLCARPRRGAPEGCGCRGRLPRPRRRGARARKGIGRRAMDRADRRPPGSPPAGRAARAPGRARALDLRRLGAQPPRRRPHDRAPARSAHGVAGARLRLGVRRGRLGLRCGRPLDGVLRPRAARRARALRTASRARAFRTRRSFSSTRSGLSRPCIRRACPGFFFPPTRASRPAPADRRPSHEFSRNPRADSSLLPRPRAARRAAGTDAARSDAGTRGAALPRRASRAAREAARRDARGARRDESGSRGCGDAGASGRGRAEDRHARAGDREAQDRRGRRRRSRGLDREVLRRRSGRVEGLRQGRPLDRRLRRGRPTRTSPRRTRAASLRTRRIRSRSRARSSTSATSSTRTSSSTPRSNTRTPSSPRTRAARRRSSSLTSTTCIPGPSMAARGLVLMPMGLVNELHEPTTFLGVRRPDVEDVIIPTTWREIGFGAYGTAGPLTYRGYMVNGLNAAGYSADEGIHEGSQEGSEALAKNWAFTGRVDFTALPGLLVGASVFTGDAGQGHATPVGRADQGADDGLRRARGLAVARPLAAGSLRAHDRRGRRAHQRAQQFRG